MTSKKQISKDKKLRGGDKAMSSSFICFKTFRQRISLMLLLSFSLNTALSNYALADGSMMDAQEDKQALGVTDKQLKESADSAQNAVDLRNDIWRLIDQSKIKNDSDSSDSDSSADEYNPIEGYVSSFAAKIDDVTDNTSGSGDSYIQLAGGTKVYLNDQSFAVFGEDGKLIKEFTSVKDLKDFLNQAKADQKQFNLIFGKVEAASNGFKLIDKAVFQIKPVSSGDPDVQQFGYSGKLDAVSNDGVTIDGYLFSEASRNLTIKINGVVVDYATFIAVFDRYKKENGKPDGKSFFATTDRSLVGDKWKMGPELLVWTDLFTSPEEYSMLDRMTATMHRLDQAYKVIIASYALRDETAWNQFLQEWYKIALPEGVYRDDFVQVAVLVDESIIAGRNMTFVRHWQEVVQQYVSIFDWASTHPGTIDINQDGNIDVWDSVDRRFDLNEDNKITDADVKFIFDMPFIELVGNVAYGKAMVKIEALMRELEGQVPGNTRVVGQLEVTTDKHSTSIWDADGDGIITFDKTKYPNLARSDWDMIKEFLMRDTLKPEYNHIDGLFAKIDKYFRQQAYTIDSAFEDIRSFQDKILSDPVPAHAAEAFAMQFREVISAMNVTYRDENINFMMRDENELMFDRVNEGSGTMLYTQMLAIYYKSGVKGVREFTTKKFGQEFTDAAFNVNIATGVFNREFQLYDPYMEVMMPGSPKPNKYLYASENGDEKWFSSSFDAEQNMYDAENKRVKIKTDDILWASADAANFVSFDDMKADLQAIQGRSMFLLNGLVDAQNKGDLGGSMYKDKSIGEIRELMTAAMKTVQGKAKDMGADTSALEALDAEIIKFNKMIETEQLGTIKVMVEANWALVNEMLSQLEQSLDKMITWSEKSYETLYHNVENKPDGKGRLAVMREDIKWNQMADKLTAAMNEVSSYMAAAEAANPTLGNHLKNPANYFADFGEEYNRFPPYGGAAVGMTDNEFLGRTTEANGYQWLEQVNGGPQIEGGGAYLERFLVLRTGVGEYAQILLEDPLVDQGIKDIVGRVFGPVNTDPEADPSENLLTFYYHTMDSIMDYYAPQRKLYVGLEKEQRSSLTYTGGSVWKLRYDILTAQEKLFTAYDKLNENYKELDRISHETGNNIITAAKALKNQVELAQSQTYFSLENRLFEAQKDYELAYAKLISQANLETDPSELQILKNKEIALTADFNKLKTDILALMDETASPQDPSTSVFAQARNFADGHIETMQGILDMIQNDNLSFSGATIENKQENLFAGLTVGRKITEWFRNAASVWMDKGVNTFRLFTEYDAGVPTGGMSDNPMTGRIEMFSENSDRTKFRGAAGVKSMVEQAKKRGTALKAEYSFIKKDIQNYVKVVKGDINGTFAGVNGWYGQSKTGVASASYTVTNPDGTKTTKVAILYGHKNGGWWRDGAPAWFVPGVQYQDMVYFDGNIMSPIMGVSGYVNNWLPMNAHYAANYGGEVNMYGGEVEGGEQLPDVVTLLTGWNVMLDPGRFGVSGMNIPSQMTGGQIFRWLGQEHTFEMPGMIPPMHYTIKPSDFYKAFFSEENAQSIENFINVTMHEKQTAAVAGAIQTMNESIANYKATMQPAYETFREVASHWNELDLLPSELDAEVFREFRVKSALRKKQLESVLEGSKVLTKIDSMYGLQEYPGEFAGGFQDLFDLLDDPEQGDRARSILAAIGERDLSSTFSSFGRSKTEVITTDAISKAQDEFYKRWDTRDPRTYKETAAYIQKLVEESLLDFDKEQVEYTKEAFKAIVDDAAIASRKLIDGYVRDIELAKKYVDLRSLEIINEAGFGEQLAKVNKQRAEAEMIKDAQPDDYANLIARLNQLEADIRASQERKIQEVADWKKQSGDSLDVVARKFYSDVNHRYAEMLKRIYGDVAAAATNWFDPNLIRLTPYIASLVDWNHTDKPKDEPYGGFGSKWSEVGHQSLALGQWAYSHLPAYQWNYDYPEFVNSTSLSFNGRMYLIGGHKYAAGNTGPVMPQLISNQVWSSTDGINWRLDAIDKFPPVQAHASVVYDGKMWVIGGNGNASSGVVYSSVNGKDWVKEANMPKMLVGHTAVTKKVMEDGVEVEKIFVIGGYESFATPIEDGRSEFVYTYDKKNGWVKLPQGPAFVNDAGQPNATFRLPHITEHATVVYNGTIYVIGGNGEVPLDLDGKPITNIVSNRRVYKSTDGINWTLDTTPLPYGVTWAKAVVFDGKIQLVGGENDTAYYGNENPNLPYPEKIIMHRNPLVFDGNTWKETGKDALPSYGLINHSITVFNGKIWAFGGREKSRRDEEEFHNLDYNYTGSVYSTDGFSNNGDGPYIQDAAWSPDLLADNSGFNFIPGDGTEGQLAIITYFKDIVDGVTTVPFPWTQENLPYTPTVAQWNELVKDFARESLDSIWGNSLRFQLNANLSFGPEILSHEDLNKYIKDHAKWNWQTKELSIDSLAYDVKTAFEEKTPLDVAGIYVDLEKLFHDSVFERMRAGAGIHAVGKAIEWFASVVPIGEPRKFTIDSISQATIADALDAKLSTGFLGYYKISVKIDDQVFDFITGYDELGRYVTHTTKITQDYIDAHKDKMLEDAQFEPLMAVDPGVDSAVIRFIHSETMGGKTIKITIRDNNGNVVKLFDVTVPADVETVIGGIFIFKVDVEGLSEETDYVASAEFYNRDAKVYSIDNIHFRTGKVDIEKTLQEIRDKAKLKMDAFNLDAAALLKTISDIRNVLSNVIKDADAVNLIKSIRDLATEIRSYNPNDAIVAKLDKELAIAEAAFDQFDADENGNNPDVAISVISQVLDGFVTTIQDAKTQADALHQTVINATEVSPAQDALAALTVLVAGFVPSSAIATSISAEAVKADALKSERDAASKDMSDAKKNTQDLLDLVKEIESILTEAKDALDIIKDKHDTLIPALNHIIDLLKDAKTPDQAKGIFDAIKAIYDQILVANPSDDTKNAAKDILDSSENLLAVFGVPIIEGEDLIFVTLENKIKTLIASLDKQNDDAKVAYDSISLDTTLADANEHLDAVKAIEDSITSVGTADSIAALSDEADALLKDRNDAIDALDKAKLDMEKLLSDIDGTPIYSRDFNLTGDIVNHYRFEVFAGNKVVLTDINNDLLVIQGKAGELIPMNEQESWKFNLNADGKLESIDRYAIDNGNVTLSQRMIYNPETLDIIAWFILIGDNVVVQQKDFSNKTKSHYFVTLAEVGDISNLSVSTVNDYKHYAKVAYLYDESLDFVEVPITSETSDPATMVYKYTLKAWFENGKNDEISMLGVHDGEESAADIDNPYRGLSKSYIVSGLFDAQDVMTDISLRDAAHVAAMIVDDINVNTNTYESFVNEIDDHRYVYHYHPNEKMLGFYDLTSPTGDTWIEYPKEQEIVLDGVLYQISAQNGKLILESLDKQKAIAEIRDKARVAYDNITVSVDALLKSIADIREVLDKVTSDADVNALMASLKEIKDRITVLTNNSELLDSMNQSFDKADDAFKAMDTKEEEADQDAIKKAIAAALDGFQDAVEVERDEAQTKHEQIQISNDLAQARGFLDVLDGIIETLSDIGNQISTKSQDAVSLKSLREDKTKTMNDEKVKLLDLLNKVDDIHNIAVAAEDLYKEISDANDLLVSELDKILSDISKMKTTKDAIEAFEGIEKLRDDIIAIYTENEDRENADNLLLLAQMAEAVFGDNITKDEDLLLEALETAVKTVADDLKKKLSDAKDAKNNVLAAVNVDDAKAQLDILGVIKKDIEDVSTKEYKNQSDQMAEARNAAIDTIGKAKQDMQALHDRLWVPILAIRQQVQSSMDTIETSFVILDKKLNDLTASLSNIHTVDDALALSAIATDLYNELVELGASEEQLEDAKVLLSEVQAGLKAFGKNLEVGSDQALDSFKKQIKTLTDAVAKTLADARKRNGDAQKETNISALQDLLKNIKAAESRFTSDKDFKKTLKSYQDKAISMKDTRDKGAVKINDAIDELKKIKHSLTGDQEKIQEARDAAKAMIDTIDIKSKEMLDSLKTLSDSLKDIPSRAQAKDMYSLVEAVYHQIMILNPDKATTETANSWIVKAKLVMRVFGASADGSDPQIEQFKEQIQALVVAIQQTVADAHNQYDEAVISNELKTIEDCRDAIKKLECKICDTENSQSFMQMAKEIKAKVAKVEKARKDNLTILGDAKTSLKELLNSMDAFKQLTAIRVQADTTKSNIDSKVSEMNRRINSLRLRLAGVRKVDAAIGLINRMNAMMDELLASGDFDKITKAQELLDKSEGLLSKLVLTEISADNVSANADDTESVIVRKAKSADESIERVHDVIGLKAASRELSDLKDLDAQLGDTGEIAKEVTVQEDEAKALEQSANSDFADLEQLALLMEALRS